MAVLEIDIPMHSSRSLEICHECGVHDMYFVAGEVLGQTLEVATVWFLRPAL